MNWFLKIYKSHLFSVTFNREQGLSQKNPNFFVNFKINLTKYLFLKQEFYLGK